MDRKINTREDVIKLCNANDVKFIRLQFCDLHGLVKNISVPIGQLEKALLSYENALSISPEHAEVYFNLGNLMLDLNQLDNAIVNYEYALKLKPGIDCNFGNLVHTKMHLCY